MAKQKRDSFTFFRSFMEVADGLDGAEWAAFVRAIFNYALDGVEPKFNDKISKALFAGIRPNLAKGWRNFDNGKNGGAPIGNTNASKPATSNENNNRNSTEKQPKNKANINSNSNSNNNINKQEQEKEKEKVQSSSQSMCVDTLEDSIDDVILSLSDLRAFCGWVLPQHGYNDVDFNAYLRSHSNPTLDNLLDYLHDEVMQSGVDMETLQSDAKCFVIELRRRQALGLPFAPSDWNEAAMQELFDGLGIPQDRMRKFYDTDCDHSEDGALSWICDTCFNGSATPEELRQELAERRMQSAIEELAKTPADKVTRQLLKYYCQLQGYDESALEDAFERILSGEVRSWQKYLDKCSHNADNEELF